MAKNLEIKAVLLSILHGEEIAKRIGARRSGVLEQVDTYFSVPAGRLKLREINRKQYELISYTRPDGKRNRYSDYRIIQVRDLRNTKALLKALFGVRCVVRKRRTLYLYQNARIHLDVVRGLGVFLELEVVVRKGTVQAKRLMALLRKEFGISSGSLIAGSYSDML